MTLPPNADPPSQGPSIPGRSPGGSAQRPGSGRRSSPAFSRPDPGAQSSTPTGRHQSGAPGLVGPREPHGGRHDSAPWTDAQPSTRPDPIAAGQADSHRAGAAGVGLHSELDIGSPYSPIPMGAGAQLELEAITFPSLSDHDTVYCVPHIREEKFLQFHEENPHVYAAILQVARSMKARKFTRGSMNMIFEHLRYTWAMKTEGGVYKLNNTWRARYSRMANQEPDLAGSSRRGGVMADKSAEDIMRETCAKFDPAKTTMAGTEWEAKAAKACAGMPDPVAGVAGLRGACKDSLRLIDDNWDKMTDDLVNIAGGTYGTLKAALEAAGG